MKKIQLKVAFLMLILFGYIASIQAQESMLKITGVVTDEKNETLPGISVVEKGTTNGVMTDVNGKFTIDVSNQQSVLTFTLVGHEKQEFVVGNKRVINVKFGENEGVNLDDVVVIGYGSVRKKDLTGSIASITEKDFQKGVTSPDRLIVGKVAGVQITPGGGAPGSGSRIRIRGGASLTASNDPLIIIDGVPLSNSGVSGSPSLLSTINPNEIESMNILKDASATAIYGSRASNGVIIITTKQGKMGAKTKVDFSTRASISQVAKKMDVMNANDMRKLIATSPYSNSDHKAVVGTYSTDWQDEIFQTAFATDNNLNITGAIKNIPFRTAISYLNEDGILKTGNMERFSASVNLNPRFFDNHLKIDVSLKGTHIKNRFANTDAIQAAVGFDPTQPVRDSRFVDYGGYFTWLLPGTDKLNTQATVNPMLLLNEYHNKAKVWRGIASAQIDYKMHFLPELRANLNVAHDYAKGDGNSFTPDWAPQMIARGGQDYDYGNTKTNQLLEFYLNYAKEFTPIKSYVDFTAGYTYQDWKTESKYYTDYTALGVPYIVPTFPFDKPRNTMISFFGRLNYTFMEKYLLTASIRRDGSSRFHEDNRWGTFPSVALAWRIKDENFLKDVKAVSDMKLRLGYGQTGQQDIGSDYGYLQNYQMGTATSQYQMGDQFYTVYRPTVYDKDLKWESTDTYNAGIDYGFFDNRISGSVDVYLKKTKDLLNRIDLPAGTNFSNKMITNIGRLENKGVEFTLNVNPVRTKDWNWTVNFNATYNENKIKKLNLVENENSVGVPAGWIAGSTGATVQMQSVGYRTYSFYLLKQVYDDNGKPLEGVYVDRNKDGVINDKDRYHMKSAEPKATFGLGTNLTYRRWSLETMLRASVGNYMYNNMNSLMAVYDNVFTPNKSILNAPTSIAKSEFKTRQPLSDYYLEDASFLKMDYLTLNYDFGKVFNNAANLRASFGVQNVFTVTNYSGIDPEISGGVDRQFYPRSRVYSLGFNLSF